MTALPKVLVVDSCRRAQDTALSTELAEMGYASVTAPFEAADDVLAMMGSPVAIVLQMSRHGDAAEQTRFHALAARLRSAVAPHGTPVIVTGGPLGAATKLQDQLCRQAAS
ncbi:hypothetical protein [Microvirga antarctica]|uniref:hypothetical protein n=1 Tax=Microvirga antarctica TaxID=2819233 RepID=UPI001B30746B|nr:hypothetical protein [Microvirga antarctica]